MMIIYQGLQDTDNLANDSKTDRHLNIKLRMINWNDLQRDLLFVNMWTFTDPRPDPSLTRDNGILADVGAIITHPPHTCT